MKKLYIFIILLICGSMSLEAQILPNIFERGKYKKDVTIKPNATQNKKNDKKKDEFELEEEETEALRFNSQFVPTKYDNPTVSNQDTTHIDEGKPLPLETEEVLYVGTDSTGTEEDEDSPLVTEDWVKIAGYYSVWDSRSIDPYGIDPSDFDEVIDLQLFDQSKNQLWSMPMQENKVTSIFGPRWGRRHSGVDLDLDTGDPINTTFDGIVRVTGWDGGGYGRFVIVRHYNGLETLYGHMSRNDIVTSGQLVKAGDLIGLGGNTGRSYGSHLHFETRYEGNPFNPQHIFEFQNNQLKGEHFLLTPDIFRSSHANLANEYGQAGDKVRIKRISWYRVRSGDTLAEIASRTGISTQKLAKKNRMSSRSTLRVGMRIRVK
jgi:murein DD-endopeptidase MepM/ murein hydrolase activator NlpD